MKIATLQFSPRLGEVAANFSRAEALLMRQEREGELTGLDLLVLPELAFAGESEWYLELLSRALENCLNMDFPGGHQGHCTAWWLGANFEDRLQSPFPCSDCPISGTDSGRTIHPMGGPHC